MEARIGVFICDCRGTLKNIDFPELRERVAGLPDVVYVAVRPDLCLEEGLKAITSAIGKEGIDRVVVAACSPEVKGEKFRRAVQEAGLNPGLVSWANIREQCSWVHEGDVTGKAFSLIRMAVNKAKLLGPLRREEVPVNRKVLVIGGGFSGMKVALELSRLGIEATLVERKPAVGGRLQEMAWLSGLGISPGGLADSLAESVVGSGSIEVLTSAEVARVEGTAGDFRVEIRRGEDKLSRSFGAIVLASGHRM
ncbi:MAG: hypothetical protein DRP95_05065, partial [Candidatus Latescibacterota bacterium]